MAGFDFLGRLKEEHDAFMHKGEKFMAIGTAYAIHPALGAAVGGYYAGEELRKQAKKDQSNQFVRMREAAERAGFNPLTVLRNTGGQGFIGLPRLSKMAAFSNAMGGMIAYNNQRSIDKYNDELRQLNLASLRADIDNTLANTTYTGILSQQAQIPEEDPYAGYKDFIPVKVGKNLQYLQIDVAKRLRILPNTPVTAGELEEIKGEIQGGFEAAVGSNIGTEVLRNAPFTGTANIKVEKLPPLANSNFDNFLDGLAEQFGLRAGGGVTSGRNKPRVRSE